MRHRVVEKVPSPGVVGAKNGYREGEGCDVTPSDAGPYGERLEALADP
jgi:hypothetical protein